MPLTQATDRDCEFARYPVKFKGGPWDGRTVPLTQELLTNGRLVAHEANGGQIVYKVMPTACGYGFVGVPVGYLA